MIETDKILLLTAGFDPEQQYYVYLPGTAVRGTWVSVHGISINANSHAEMLAPYAREGGFLLVVPVFTKEHCPSYNIFGKSESGFRGDLQLIRILEDVRQRTGISAEPFFLFGYSAGGQFAHRFIMNYPEKVRAGVICSPGYYTFPTREADYPYGLRGMEEAIGRKFDLESFLRVPLLVNVGDEDVLRTPNFLQIEEIDRTQGRSRVERAKRWFDCVQALSDAHGIHTDRRFELLPGVGHGFENTMEKTDLGRLALRFFRSHCE